MTREGQGRVLALAGGSQEPLGPVGTAQNSHKVAPDQTPQTLLSMQTQDWP